MMPCRSLRKTACSVRLLAIGLGVALAGSRSEAQAVGEPLGRVLAGGVVDAFIDGDRAIMASSRSVTIFDVSDPLERRELGSVEVGDNLVALAVDGNRAFALTQASVYAIDLSTPARPRVTGSAAMPGPSGQELALRGTALYVTFGGDVAVFDVSDPAAPSLEVVIDSSTATGNGISVFDDRCYAGTLFLDISNPLAPVVLSDTMPSADHVVLHGDTAYVGIVAEVLVLDVSNPAAPVTLPGGVDHQDIHNFVTGMAFVDDVLYYAVWFDEDWDNDDCTTYSSNTVVYAKDFSDAAHPQWIDSTRYHLQFVDDIHPAGSSVSYVRAGRVVHRAHAEFSLADDWTLPLGIVAVEPTADPDIMLLHAGDLQWLDVSDPTRPRRIGFGAGPATSAFVGVGGLGIEPDGDRCFVFGGTDEDCFDTYSSPWIHWISLEREGNHQLDSFSTHGFNYYTDAVRIGDRLLVANSQADEDLVVIEIRPTVLILDRSIDLPGGGAFSLALKGSTLLAANGAAGLVSLDASDPSNPTLLDTLALPGPAQSVAVAGSLAAVGTNSGFSLVDVSDPSDLRVLASVAGPPALHLSIQGNLLAVSRADHNTIYLYDLTVPQSPRLILTTGPGIPRLGEGVLYGYRSNGLSTFDLLGAAAIADHGTTPGSDSAFGVEIHDGMAYLADYTGGLRIVDLANGPTTIGVFPSADRMYEARVVQTPSGLLAYVADGAGGLRIIDVTQPGEPSLVGALALSDLAIALAVDDGHAYVGTRFDGLQIVDVSTPGTPVLVGSVDTPGSAQSVMVVEGRAYVADGTAGVQIVDVSDPSAPQIVGSFDTPLSARQVLVRGPVAFVPDRASGLLAFDVSDPADARLISALGGMTDARGIAAFGRYGFVADFDGQMHMVDLADPGDMRIVRSVATLGTCRAAATDGAMIALADGAAGLTLFELIPEWACPADLARDGVLDFFDLQAFLNAFADGVEPADWNDDGVFDFFDVLGYLGDYALGCG